MQPARLVGAMLLIAGK